MNSIFLAIFSNNIFVICFAIISLVLFVSKNKKSVIMFFIIVALLDVFIIINNLILLDSCDRYLVNKAKTFEYAKMLIGTENIFVCELYKIFIVIFFISIVISCLFDKSLIAILLIITLYASMCFISSVMIGIYSTGKNVSIIYYTFPIGCNCIWLSFNLLLIEKIK